MINESYENLIEPSNFKTLFKNQKEFESWLDKGSVKDLKETLKAFENSQEYELCILINDKILSLQNETI